MARWLRWVEVAEIVPVSRAQVDRYERVGQFPRRVKPNPEHQRGRVYWREDEVLEWLESRRAVYPDPGR